MHTWMAGANTVVNILLLCNTFAVLRKRHRVLCAVQKALFS